jgi:hypothetical protein
MGCISAHSFQSPEKNSTNTRFLCRVGSSVETATAVDTGIGVSETVRGILFPRESIIATRTMTSAIKKRTDFVINNSLSYFHKNSPNLALGLEKSFFS